MSKKLLLDVDGRDYTYTGREISDGIFAPDYFHYALEDTFFDLKSVTFERFTTGEVWFPGILPTLWYTNSMDGGTYGGEWYSDTHYFRRVQEMMSDMDAFLTSINGPSTDAFLISNNPSTQKLIIQVTRSHANPPQITCPDTTAGKLMHKLTGLPIYPEILEIYDAGLTTVSKEAPYVYDLNYGIDRIFISNPELGDEPTYASCHPTIDMCISEAPYQRATHIPDTGTTGLGTSYSSIYNWSPNRKTLASLKSETTFDLREMSVDFGTTILGDYVPLVAVRSTTMLFHMESIESLVNPSVGKAGF